MPQETPNKSVEREARLASPFRFAAKLRRLTRIVGPS
jgi:hypothetical protein